MCKFYYISQLRVLSVTTFCTFSLLSVFHQHVMFQTKIFLSFQVPFSSFLLARPSPGSSSVPVGGDFSLPPTPFDTLFFPFFFFCQSLLPIFVHAFSLMSCQSQSFHFASLFHSSLCSLLKHSSFSQEHFCFFSPAYSTPPIQHPTFQVPCSLKGTLN